MLLAGLALRTHHKNGLKQMCTRLALLCKQNVQRGSPYMCESSDVNTDGRGREHFELTDTHDVVSQFDPTV